LTEYCQEKCFVWVNILPTSVIFLNKFTKTVPAVTGLAAFFGNQACNAICAVAIKYTLTRRTLISSSSAAYTVKCCSFSFFYCVEPCDFFIAHCVYLTLCLLAFCEDHSVR